MKDERKYIFCGNRPCVLSAMLNLGLNIVDVLLVENQYLRSFCETNSIKYTLVKSKKDVLLRLEQANYDIFVSNGCPYILPVSSLAQATSAMYLNVHPSLLPDLRGSDPVPGAILFGRKSGATCYVMNDQLDAGDIISQIEINAIQGMDVTLLYQLSFKAEYDVFHEAWQKAFTPIATQKLRVTDIYYTFKQADLTIDWSANHDQIIRRIKAFNNRSKGCHFHHNQTDFKVYDAEWVKEPYITQILANTNENEVFFVYERNVAIAKDNGLLVLKQVEGDLTQIHNGEKIV